MIRWLADRLQALRSWFAARLGLSRGEWRHGVVQVSAVPFAFNPFVPHAWRYSLYTPGGLADDSAAPLVIVLHGCRQRASSFAVAAGLTRLADRTRVRLLCPQQRRVANPYRCWNWFGPLAQAGAGELSVVLAMLDEVETQVRVDREAVAAVGFSAGGGLAALLAFHATRRLRASVVVAGPPLLGHFVVQDPREVMHGGLQFAPELALGLRQTACVPLAIIQGAVDAVVHPQCASQLAAQALESLRRAGIAVTRHEQSAGGPTSVVDYRSGDVLRLRRIDVPDLGHEWTGGPGGHPFCARDGYPLSELCGEFLSDAGVLPRGRAPTLPR
jgi:poly(hydroxyalkanoate) depolymerase family esterase